MSGTMRKNPRIRVPPSELLNLEDTIIKITVGGAKTFHAHSCLLTSRSEYFKRALNGNWSESDDRTINLEDDDPSIFALYLNLVYRSTIPTYNNTGADGGAEHISLAKLFVLCEKLQDLAGKNAVVGAILDKSGEPTTAGKKICPGPKPIACIYEGTPTNSLARKLMVDLFVEHAGPRWVVDEKGEPKEFPLEFLFDVTVQFLERCKLPGRLYTDEEGAAERYCEKEREREGRKGEGGEEEAAGGVATVAVIAPKEDA